MIYVVSGVAQYAMGRRIIDRYPLKVTHIVARTFAVIAMLALAMGNGYVALLGAIGSAVLSSAAGPIENILDRALHAQPLSRPVSVRNSSWPSEPGRDPADRRCARRPEASNFCSSASPSSRS